jgi:phosphoglycolate phosphatase
MKHLLWDIDGTLLTTNGAGVQPFKRAIEKFLGQPVEFRKGEYAGRTDYEIANLHLSSKNLTNLNFTVEEVVRDYAEGLSSALIEISATPFPNIPLLLRTLSESQGYALSIVTGNCFKGAIAKLESAKLMKYFPSNRIFYSRDLSPRWTIVEEALHNLLKEDDEAVVIGDTVHDLLAAQKCNVPAILLSHSTSQNFSEELRQQTKTLPPNWSVLDFIKLIEDVN